MTRNPIAHHMDPTRHGRKTTERTGMFVRGPKKNRMGTGKGGRLKGRGRLRSR